MQALRSTRVTRPLGGNALQRRHMCRRLGKPVCSLDAPDITPFIEKDKATNLQLANLKRAAATYMEQLLEHLAKEAAAGGSEGEDAASATTSSSAAGGEAPKASSSGAGAAQASTAALKRKIKYAIRAMQTGLVERDTEVRLLLLAALCREHVLYIGPPGTAKSEIGRRLNKLIRGAYFERLLTRFSVPEELFGPLSMQALEQDQYVRKTLGYLPEAEVAFIDEIFKANSAILNTLLTLLNERLFDNGSQRVRAPLVTLVGASNELPESEELDALYDRFLLRKQVRQVSGSGLTQMLDYYAGNSADATSDDEEGAAAAAGSGNGAAAAPDRGAMAAVDPDMMLSQADFDTTRRAAVARVRVPASIIQLLADLRSYLQDKCEPPAYVSDRRLVKAVALMQVAAYCNGRAEVSEYDCLLLEHVLWQRPEEAGRIADWLLGQLAADDGIKQVSYLLNAIFSRACKTLGGGAADDGAKLGELRAEAGNLRRVLADKLVQVSRNLEGGFPIVRDNLWLGRDDAEAVASALLPKLDKTKAAVEALLYEVATLEVALQANTDAVTLANLMPKHWADFIRNAPMEEVKPIGTAPLKI